MTPSLAPSMSGRDWAILLFLGLAWGSSFLFTNIAVRDIPPVTLVLYRTGLATLALVLFMLARGISFRPFMERPAEFFLFGLLSAALPFFLICTSQKFIGPGLGGIFNATVPLMIVPLAHIFTRDEKFNLRKFIGVIVGFFGVVVLIGPGALHGFGNDLLAELAALAASLAYALGGIYARRFKLYDPVIPAAGGLGAAALFMLPLSFLVDGGAAVQIHGIGALSAVIVLALFPTAFCFILFYALLARAGATNSSLVTFIIPISAVLLGFLFRNESLQLADFVGMAIIGLSLVILDGRLFRRRNSTPVNAKKFDENARQKSPLRQMKAAAPASPAE